MENCRKRKVDYQKMNTQQAHLNFSLKLALDFYTDLLCYGLMRGVDIIDSMLLFFSNVDRCQPLIYITEIRTIHM